MFEWTDHAACRGLDPEAFALPLTPAGVVYAQGVCAGCPVAAECLADTPADDRETVRGGLTPDERRALARTA